jgi:hypothetical protein
MLCGACARIAADQYGDGLRFRKAGEIPEVAVEAVGVVAVAIAYALGGRRNDGDAIPVTVFIIRELVEQALAAGGEGAVFHESSESFTIQGGESFRGADIDPAAGVAFSQ